jgi:hypothetical protein
LHLPRLRRGYPRQSGYDAFFVTGLSGEALRQEIFFLAYHLHWSHDDILQMASPERRAFVRLLIEQIERENAQIKSARGG